MTGSQAGRLRSSVVRRPRPFSEHLLCARGCPGDTVTRGSPRGAPAPSWDAQMQTTGPADLGRKAADSGAAQGVQRRPRKSVGLAADRDAALWVPGLLVATTGPGDHSTVSSRQQRELPGSFSEPKTSTGAASPPVGTRGPHPCGWLAPGCPCGLQEGLRAHLRPISQSHTQMSPLVALGKHSANHRATKRAASHGFKCICSSPWPGAHTLLPARPSPPSRGQVVRITNTPRPLPGPLGLSVSPNLL